MKQNGSSRMMRKETRYEGYIQYEFIESGRKLGLIILDQLGQRDYQVINMQYERIEEQKFAEALEQLRNDYTRSGKYLWSGEYQSLDGTMRFYEKF